MHLILTIHVGYVLSVRIQTCAERQFRCKDVNCGIPVTALTVRKYWFKTVMLKSVSLLDTFRFRWSILIFSICSFIDSHDLSHMESTHIPVHGMHGTATCDGRNDQNR